MKKRKWNKQLPCHLQWTLRRHVLKLLKNSNLPSKKLPRPNLRYDKTDLSSFQKEQIERENVQRREVAAMEARAQEELKKKSDSWRDGELS